MFHAASGSSPAGGRVRFWTSRYCAEQKRTPSEIVMPRICGASSIPETADRTGPPRRTGSSAFADDDVSTCSIGRELHTPVIPGRAAELGFIRVRPYCFVQVGNSRLRWRGPGIHLAFCAVAKWIPGSMLARRPGMTAVGVMRRIQFASRSAPTVRRAMSLPRRGPPLVTINICHFRLDRRSRRATFRTGRHVPLGNMRPSQALRVYRD
jgi:hypothetical protein